MSSIKHPATVINIDNKLVRVKITRFSACHNCEVRNSCGLIEYQNKELDIYTNSASDFVIGQQVEVAISKTTGWKAVFYCYIAPLILMLITLITATSLGLSEVIGGISAIIVLIPYYFGLFLFRKRISQKLKFDIIKITE